MYEKIIFIMIFCCLSLQASDRYENRMVSISNDFKFQFTSTVLPTKDEIKVSINDLKLLDSCQGYELVNVDFAKEFNLKKDGDEWLFDNKGISYSKKEQINAMQVASFIKTYFTHKDAFTKLSGHFGSTVEDGKRILRDVNPVEKYVVWDNQNYDYCAMKCSKEGTVTVYYLDIWGNLKPELEAEYNAFRDLTIKKFKLGELKPEDIYGQQFTAMFYVSEFTSLQEVDGKK